MAVALLLAELVGPAGEVLALDPSEADVRAGHAIASAGQWQNVELESVPLDAGGGIRIPPLSCDLLYAVNVLAVSADLDAAGESLAASLPFGHQLIVEEQDLDECAAGSTSPALRRWQSLRGELARRGGRSDGAGRASVLLVGHGFHIDEVEAAQPAFVQGGGCHIPVAELEAARAALLDSGLLSDAGVDELTQALIEETSTPGQLVLWPRVVFVQARRSAVPSAAGTRHAGTVL